MSNKTFKELMENIGGNNKRLIQQVNVENVSDIIDLLKELEFKVNDEAVRWLNYYEGGNPPSHVSGDEEYFRDQSEMFGDISDTIEKTVREIESIRKLYR